MPEASKSAQVRSQLSHPVVDCDGHWIDPLPILLEYVEKVGGADLAEEYRAIRLSRGNPWYKLSPEERLHQRRTRAAWWVSPGNTFDRATTMLPGLLYERLDDIGLDFAVIIGTAVAVGLDGIQDPKKRRLIARASNIMNSEMFAEYSDRITPAASIPTTTPEEAIEEAEFAVKELGFKVALVNGSIKRPIPALAKDGTDRSSLPYFVDSLALDSLYDYDPLWEAFVELKLAPISHAISMGWVDRCSPNNFVYNHLGHFAQAAHSFARAVYLGGVTRRFPTLNFGFLECGVAWARILCSDMAAHWEKRNEAAMLANLSPANLDLDRMRELFDQYGGKWFEGRTEELLANIDAVQVGSDVESLVGRETDLDDFAAVGVHSAEEAAEEFARAFFFGCESDDPLVSLAFDPKLGPRLKPMFSSDISHWDVTDMTEVLEEAYELVEDGALDERDFRDFAFSNAVQLHGGVNPDFFKGTIVEKAAAEELERLKAAASASTAGSATAN